MGDVPKLTSQQAAYDAEQRRQIRIEAMRECASKAQDLRRTSMGAATIGLLIAIDGIRELIDAEEASNG